MCLSSLFLILTRSSYACLSASCRFTLDDKNEKREYKIQYNTTILVDTLASGGYISLTTTSNTIAEFVIDYF